MFVDIDHECICGERGGHRGGRADDLDDAGLPGELGALQEMCRGT